MPFALKEGLANVNKNLMDPFPVNNQLGGFVATMVCPWIQPFISYPQCVVMGDNYYRKRAVTGATRRYSALPQPDIFRPWQDCHTLGSDAGCELVLPPGVVFASGASRFIWRGQVNTYNAAYRLVPQVALDIWESGASNTAAEISNAEAEDFAARFGDISMRAYLLLESDASFIDWQHALRVATLQTTGGAWQALETARRSIDEAMARHGINALLAGYCAREERECH